MKQGRRVWFAFTIFIIAFIALFSIYSLLRDRRVPGLPDTPGLYRSSSYPGVFFDPVPGMSGTLDGVSVRFNAQGFRGPEIAVPKPEGVTRIVLVGDSFVFGQGVDEPGTLSAQLERKLNERLPGRRWETVNAGQRGYNMTDYVITFQPRVMSLSPDLVVLVLTEVNDPELERFMPRSEKLDRWKSAGWTKIPFVKPFLTIPLMTEINHLFVAHVISIYDPSGPDWPVFRSRLETIVDTCREARVPLVIVSFPYLEDDDLFHEQRLQLQKTVIELGVPLIDPRPEFAKFPAQDLQVQRPKDFHPNALALGITADLLIGPIESLTVHPPSAAAP